jgi:predicted DNA binding CopG/RHH family protein
MNNMPPFYFPLAALNRNMPRKSTKAAPKKDLYRRHPLIAFRLNEGMIAAIDKWAANRGLTRSGAIRHMIEKSLHRSRE